MYNVKKKKDFYNRKLIQFIYKVKKFDVDARTIDLQSQRQTPTLSTIHIFFNNSSMKNNNLFKSSHEHNTIQLNLQYFYNYLFLIIFINLY